jgi:hypothetical protein
MASPLLPYYLAGYQGSCCTNNRIDIVLPNNTVISTEDHGDAEHHAYTEALIAVFGAVRTTGGNYGYTGYEYDETTGAYMPGDVYTNGATYPNPDAPPPLLYGDGMTDGATNGATNYSVEWGSGRIYTFGPNWGSGVGHVLPDPNNPGYFLNINASLSSVAYDWKNHDPGYIWVLSTGGNLWHVNTGNWTVSGPTLLSADDLDHHGGFWQANGLAMDIDGSFWFVDDWWVRSGDLFHYDPNALPGHQMSITHIADLEGFVAYGGDIDLSGRGGAGGEEVPEPGTLGVMGLALLALWGIRRRR